MHVSADAPGLKARSERLDAYLDQDPANEQLLCDAFEAAVAAGRFDVAARHLSTGLAVGNPDGWRFRHATLAIAEGHLEDAKRTLVGLWGVAGEAPPAALRFNLGYVHFRLEDYAACVALLEPLLDHMPAAQPFWLRALHQLGQVERAWNWIGAALADGRPLQTEACGVASLIAVDADQLRPAERLADRALRELPDLAEALVARGSVALARQDGAGARKFAIAALQRRDDGRARSLLGFARLLQQDLPGALTEFERAVGLMPGHVGTWQGIGWTRLLMQDLNGARDAFDKALALDRNFAESHGSLAVALVMAGQLDEARAGVERALRLDAGSVAARYAELLMSGKGRDARELETLARQVLGRRARSTSDQEPSGGGASNN